VVAVVVAADMIQVAVVVAAAVWYCQGQPLLLQEQYILL
jgi:hypothetical protein